MTVNLKPLSESILRRLTNDALMTFLGDAEHFEAAARPGLHLVLSNEPMADMNMLVAGVGADNRHFRDMARSCLDRQLPFLVLIFPEAGDALDAAARELGLVYAVDFPMMVRDDLPLEPAGHSDVLVVRGTEAADARASAGLSLIHISEPTRPFTLSRMPSSA